MKGSGTIPVRGSQLGRVVVTGVPLCVRDAGLEKDDLLPLLAPDGPLGPAVVVPVRSEDEIIGALAIGRAQGPGCRPFTNGDLSVLHGITEMGGTAIQRARLDRNLQQADVQMVLALARATASRDSHTDLHSFRLVTLAEQIARALGLGADEIEEIRWGARLHDIGKVGVPDSILHKPGPLTKREQAVMRRHPMIGEEILARVERMRGVAKLVRHHQERWNGTGYPDGLAGDAIPSGARILAVVDAYGAIIERRRYKRARSHEEAIAEIRRGAGSQFDPAIVKVFCRMIEQSQPLDEPIAE